MSPTELAAESGLSLRTIERIEAGTVKPHRATVKVIADALELAADHPFRTVAVA